MGDVRRLTGLTERRIRYYERQGLLEPLRTPGHQRQYTSRDVDRLKEIKRLLDDGVPLKGVKDRLAQFREQMSLDEPGDAASYFRGQQWVRRGQMESSGFPLSNRPDIMRRLERDSEE